MTFKLVSQVNIYQFQRKSGEEFGQWLPDTVFSRERTLKPGEILSLKGEVATDQETRGLWSPANVKIKVIDNDHLQVKWTKDWLAKFPIGIFLSGYYDETKIKGSTRLEIDDPYHKIDKETFPETFTSRDKLRIPPLIKETLKDIDGSPNVRKETQLIHEPTLPSKA